MLAVVIAGVTAVGLGGNYLYFGHPAIHPMSALVIPEVILIGTLGGLLGGGFAKLLADPALTRLPKLQHIYVGETAITPRTNVPQEINHKLVF